jgi:C4-type Zn-finger protein
MDNSVECRVIPGDKRNADECPCCGFHADLVEHRVDYDGNDLFVQYYCDGCGAEWVDYYKLVDTIIIRESEQK